MNDSAIESTFFCSRILPSLSQVSLTSICDVSSPQDFHLSFETLQKSEPFKFFTSYFARNALRHTPLDFKVEDLTERSGVSSSSPRAYKVSQNSRVGLSPVSTWQRRVINCVLFSYLGSFRGSDIGTRGSLHGIKSECTWSSVFRKIVHHGIYFLPPVPLINRAALGRRLEEGFGTGRVNFFQRVTQEQGAAASALVLWQGSRRFQNLLCIRFRSVHKHAINLALPLTKILFAIDKFGFDPLCLPYKLFVELHLHSRRQ